MAAAGRWLVLLAAACWLVLLLPVARCLSLDWLLLVVGVCLLLLGTSFQSLLGCCSALLLLWAAAVVVKLITEHLMFPIVFSCTAFKNLMHKLSA